MPATWLKASSRLVEPLEVQRKAKLGKHAKNKSELAHGSVLTSNYDRSTFPASQTISKLENEAMESINIRIGNDLKTPDELQAYSVLNS